MKKITALYGKGKNCTLYSDNSGSVTQFKLAARFALNNAMLYVWDEKLYRLELDAQNTAVLNEKINVRAAFVVLGGRIAFESSFASAKKAFFERIRSEILNRESKQSYTEQKEENESQSENTEEKKNEDNEYTSEEFQSEAMKSILKKAEELFSLLSIKANEETEKKSEQADTAFDENALFNPFPDAFPRSVWKKVAYPGTNRYYLEGRAIKDGMRLIIHALPGEYSPVNPMMSRNGFKKFMRARDGSGYWLKIRRQKNPLGF